LITLITQSHQRYKDSEVFGSAKTFFKKNFTF